MSISLRKPPVSRPPMQPSLLVSDYKDFPKVSDKNKDQWHFFAQRRHGVIDSKTGAERSVFSVLARCDYTLDSIFEDRPEFRQRVFDVLQTRVFRFMVQRATLEAYFEDRLHANLVRHYEAFKEDVADRYYLEKKEELVLRRFERSFNFGGILGNDLE